MGFLVDEVGFDKLKGEDNRASFTTRGGTVGRTMVKLKEIIVAVDAKRGVSEVRISFEVFFEVFEVLFGRGSGNFGFVSEIYLILVFCDRAVGGVEVGVDFGGELLAKLIEISTIFG